MSKRSKREAEQLAEIAEIAEELAAANTSSLMVAVDFNGLLEQVDEVKAWDILGKLKDLLE